ADGAAAGRRDQEAGANPARSRHCDRGASPTTPLPRAGWEGRTSDDPGARRLTSARSPTRGRGIPKEALHDRLGRSGISSRPRWPRRARAARPLGWIATRLTVAAGTAVGFGLLAARGEAGRERADA